MQVRNDSGEIIPAYGIMRITGVVVVKQQAIITVGKPNTYGGRDGRYLVNEAYPIESGGYGEAQRGPYVSVHFDTGDAAIPGVGDLWGPVDGSWKAKRYVPGFRIVGLPEAGENIVTALMAPMMSVLIKTDASHAKGASGTCSIYHGNTPGSEFDSTYNLTAWNRFVDLEATTWGRVVPVADDDFELVDGESTEEKEGILVTSLAAPSCVWDVPTSATARRLSRDPMTGQLVVPDGSETTDTVYNSDPDLDAVAGTYCRWKLVNGLLQFTYMGCGDSAAGCNSSSSGGWIRP